MAMTKEEQKAAAKRIMEKMGPMDEQESETYEMLTKNPKQYVPPDVKTGKRVCGVCGAEFQDQKLEGREVSALEQFSDHSTVHNPSPAQWKMAHEKIQAGKELAKG
jgi:hypothetical protein